MVILGGIREIGPEDNGSSKYIEEKRACRRFIKKTYMKLGKIWLSTPLGHITVMELEDELHEFREELYEYAVVHNRKNRNWQILIELSWTPLNEESTSTLLALVEDLPKEFWE